MVQVHFNKQAQYTFAATFFQASGNTRPDAILSPEALKIETDEPTMGMLLKRISEGQTAVMPYVGQDDITWIIAGANQRELDQTMRYIKRFLMPTYARFTPTGDIPKKYTFDSSGKDSQQAGAEIYPAGYYRLVSRSSDQKLILQRLKLWLDLEASRPTQQVEQHHSYRDLATAFHAALAAANWTEAEQCLQEMQRLNLSTADNLAFLEIQLLAQQRRWSEIWNHADFALLSRMRVPRMVRAALLTAFHHSELLKLEQSGAWEQAFETFKQHRPSLGLLLTGRFGLSQVPVVQVFAYQAVLDADRTSFEALRAVQDDQQVQICLDYLQSLLPPEPEVSKPLLPPHERIRQALAFSDFDTALHAIRDMEPIAERATLLVEIAFHSGDVQVAEHALLTFWELEDTVQQHIQQSEPRIPYYLDFLGSLVDTPKNDDAVPTIRHWLEWFQLAQDVPDSPYLASALDQMPTTHDDRFWTTERVDNLYNALLVFVTDQERISRTYVSKAIQNLITLFLQDNAFPRSHETYDNLYEALYLGLLETQKPSETASMTLLRLAESLLSNQPGRCHSFWENLSAWLQVPVPALETSVLEAFELLMEYGLSGNELTTWYRTWVDHLISLPTTRERVNLETWLAFGKWMQTVPDLVSRLEQMLTDSVDQDTENPIGKLPDGYRIGIFSLRESSAQRVKQLLEARNSSLNVRICTEKDLNEQAKAIAQNADLVVVVWTCLSHALSYGIEPYLQEKPVFPQSSGSTSIMRAIEERVRQTNRI